MLLLLLAGIIPPDIRRETRVANIIATAKNNTDHLLHHKVTAAATACQQRLMSRRPFSRHAARLSNDNHDHVRRGVIASIASTPPQPIPVLLSGEDLPRKQCVKLNRMRCGTARVSDTLKLWGAE